MGSEIRFTPDEIKELVASGDLKLDDLSKMHPQDRAVAMPLLAQQKPGDTPGSKIGAMVGPPALGALGGKAITAAGPALQSMGSGMLPMAGGAAGLYGIEKLKGLGLPSSIASALEAALGFKMMMGSGGKGGSTPPVAQSVEQELLGKGIGAESAAAAAAGKRGPLGPKPVQRVPAMGSNEIPEHVKGGVQNDFRGRVTFEEPPVPQRKWEDMNLRDAYPPNIKTEPSIEDLIEMVTGASHGRGEGPTPVRYEDPDTRNAVDRLKRKTARRAPR